MIIQFNSDKNITGKAKFVTPIINLISTKLNIFSDEISRVEVHLTNEDCEIDNPMDKRCMMEARFAGMQPVAVTNMAETHEKAVGGAVDLLRNSLLAIIGHMTSNSVK